MSELRKATTDHPYFITISVVGWVDVFTRQSYNDVLIQSLAFCIHNKNLEIYAYVIMPSHIHMIVRSPQATLPSILRDFKSFTAKKIISIIKHESGESRKEWMLHVFEYHARFRKQNEKYMFWQKTNYRIELNYPSIFHQKMDYIQNNPVKAGYVTDSNTWYYSSSCSQSPLKIINP